MLHSLERHLHLFVLLFLSIIHVCFGWNNVSIKDIGRAVENAQWLLLLQKQQCLVLERTGFGIFCRNEMSKMQTFWRSQHPPPILYNICIKLFLRHARLSKARRPIFLGSKLEQSAARSGFQNLGSQICYKWWFKPPQMDDFMDIDLKSVDLGRSRGTWIRISDFEKSQNWCDMAWVPFWGINGSREVVIVILFAVPKWKGS